MSELKKRTWHYVCSPKSFEIAGCSCGNEQTQWSEYEKHLWCDKCNIDFIPEHNGIFSGPIPINISRMLGLDFSIYNMSTGKIEVLGSDNKYIEFQTNDSIFKEQKIMLRMADKTDNSGNLEGFTATGYINTQDYSISVTDFPENKNINILQAEVAIGQANEGFFEPVYFKLEIKCANNQFKVVENKNFVLLQKYVLQNNLNQGLKENNLIKKSKI